MEFTELAKALKKARDDNTELTNDQDELASCGGSDDFGYALFEGGYIKPEDWIIGEDLEKLKEAIKLVEEFKNFYESVKTEM